MATLRNKQKLAAVTRETQEERPRNSQSRNRSVPRINEEYITQVSEEIEGRVTKTMSQEFSRTESRILGALYKLDEFLLNPQIRTHSGTIPGTFRKTNVETREPMRTTPKVILILKQASYATRLHKNSGPEVGHDMMTRVQKESLCGHDTIPWQIVVKWKSLILMRVWLEQPWLSYFCEKQLFESSKHKFDQFMCFKDFYSFSPKM